MGSVSPPSYLFCLRRAHTQKSILFLKASFVASLSLALGVLCTLKSGPSSPITSLLDWSRVVSLTFLARYVVWSTNLQILLSRAPLTRLALREAPRLLLALAITEGAVRSMPGRLGGGGGGTIGDKGAALLVGYAVNIIVDLIFTCVS